MTLVKIAWRWRHRIRRMNPMTAAAVAAITGLAIAGCSGGSELTTTVGAAQPNQAETAPVDEASGPDPVEPGRRVRFVGVVHPLEEPLGSEQISDTYAVCSAQLLYSTLTCLQRTYTVASFAAGSPPSGDVFRENYAEDWVLVEATIHDTTHVLSDVAVLGSHRDLTRPAPAVADLVEALPDGQATALFFDGEPYQTVVGIGTTEGVERRTTVQGRGAALDTDTASMRERFLTEPDLQILDAMSERIGRPNTLNGGRGLDGLAEVIGVEIIGSRFTVLTLTNDPSTVRALQELLPGTFDVLAIGTPVSD